jgi:hypothetical protein
MLKSKIEFLGKEYNSIEGVLKAYYKSDEFKGDLATYRDRAISLGIEDDEDKSLYEHVEEQILEINKVLDGE